jgi:hypothetical protein
MICCAGWSHPSPDRLYLMYQALKKGAGAGSTGHDYRYPHSMDQTTGRSGASGDPAWPTRQTKHRRQTLIHQATSAGFNTPRPGPPAENAAGRCRPPAVRCRHPDGRPMRREPAVKPESGSTHLPASVPSTPLWTKACSSSGRVPVVSVTALSWTTAGYMGPEHCVPPVARQFWSTPIPPLPVDWTMSTAPTLNP